LLLPYYQTGKNLTSQARSHRTFGSSDLAFWVQETTASRPLKILNQGSKMSGLALQHLRDHTFNLLNDFRYIVGLFPHIETANIPENKLLFSPCYLIYRERLNTEIKIFCETY